MQTVLQDLRYAVRQQVRNPGFTLTATISLALGIGATTAVFSVIYAALLNPYPYKAADRIVRLILTSKAAPEFFTQLNGPQIQQLRQLPIAEDVLAMDYHLMTFTNQGVQESLNAISLTPSGFKDLDVPPVLGREILPTDAIDGHDPEPVVVLSYKLWQKNFFSNPDVLGKVIQLDHKSYAVVGVAAPRFTWYNADVYLPLKLGNDAAHMYMATLLLRPGVGHEIANAALQTPFEQFARDMPNHLPEHFKVKVQGLNDWVVKTIGSTLYLLFGAVGLLLVIGCGNVSILLLARGTARQHELAIRSALGAQRRRVVRQLLTEALLLASMGAALGVLTSYGILAVIKVLLPKYAFAPEVVIRINLPVLLFCVAVAMATGILFGLWPALQLSRTQVGQTMQSNARRVAGSVHGRKAHNLLIAGQIALTLLLLAAAGSAMEEFARLLHEPLGYDPHNVMAIGIPLQENSFPSWAGRGAYLEQIRSKVAETPGVTSAAISTSATPPENNWNGRFEILGRPPSEEQLALIELVSPEFFATLRIPLLQGRVWDKIENHNGAHLAVINRTMAKQYFPNGDAIGHSIKFPTIENRPPMSYAAENAAQSWLVIVGIVDDNLNSGLRKPVRPAAFVPYTLWLVNFTELLVRTQSPPLIMLRSVLAQVSAVNSAQQTFHRDVDLETWISEEPEWQTEHLTVWIFGIFAGLALLLVAIGLYSVVSYTVAQRINEFGIRMALGAQRGHILRVVFESTVASVGSGMLAGVLLTLALHSFLASWVGGDHHYPILLPAGAAVLGFVSALASYFPARRASHVDPMTALRCD